MDKVKSRIIIEVLIAEISETKNENAGVQMGFGSEYGIGISGWGGSEVTPIGSLLASLEGDGIPSIPEGGSFGLGSNKNSKFKFGLLVQAIKKNGGSNILSTPLINTIDGVEAEFIVGKNVPFVTGVETGENPFQSIKREDVGLKLKVLPEILHNGEIRLHVEQEISSISGSTKLDDIITDKRFLKTKIMATDGDLIILGGLMDKSGGDNSKKIPVLGDIPYIGSLFRYDGTTDEKRKLLIFMRPRIITNENKDQIMKEVLRNQNLQYSKPLEIYDAESYLDDEDDEY
jgi:general secretion pathway protein D